MARKLPGVHDRVVRFRILFVITFPTAAIAERSSEQVQVDESYNHVVDCIVSSYPPKMLINRAFWIIQ